MKGIKRKHSSLENSEIPAELDQPSHRIKLNSDIHENTDNVTRPKLYDLTKMVNYTPTPLIDETLYNEFNECCRIVITEAQDDNYLSLYGKILPVDNVQTNYLNLLTNYLKDEPKELDRRSIIKLK